MSMISWNNPENKYYDPSYMAQLKYEGSLKDVAQALLAYEELKSHTDPIRGFVQVHHQKLDGHIGEHFLDLTLRVLKRVVDCGVLVTAEIYVQSLEERIKAYLYTQLNKEGAALTPEESSMIVVGLSTFCRAAIDKYIKGSKEHGGSLLVGRDYNKEIANEILDLFWYNVAKTTKQDENKTQGNS